MSEPRCAEPPGSLLVVDDDLGARQSMETFLSREGYEVRCAPSGRTALLFSREDPPELILLDVRLPDMDGYEVCRRLKQDPATRDIPVIFISGLGMVADKVMGFAAGGADYIIKPFQADEVLARVGAHLSIKRLQDRVAAQNKVLEAEVAKSREAEDALRLARDTLELRVEERTRELADANAQLLASQWDLSERLQFETVLSDISARFVELPAEKVDSGIEAAQRRVCESLGLDLSVLWQWVPDAPEMISLTHLYRPMGGPPVPEPMDAATYFPWILERLRDGEIISFSSPEELPAAAERDLETLRSFEIQSNLAIPIAAGGGPLIGVISFNTMHEKRQWPQALVKRLQLVAQVFANALVRKRMEEELRGHLKEISDLKLRLEIENVYLQEEVKLLVKHTEIVGQSRPLKQVLAQAEQVAATDATVLILGETGTGKELLARAIHDMSGRRERPLITVNCAALPPTLVESELFGREKGAYTGAMTQMIGRFELADGSTLFLDEIGEIPSEVQVKLLRVLEVGRFERLGSTKSKQVDVRVIAATNRNLAEDVGAGRFRKDLFYRLNVFPITIPPLRERLEDIPQLVWAFVQQLENTIGKRIDSIPKKCMQALLEYAWPGNIRELKNVIEHAMIVSSGGTLNIAAPKPVGVGSLERADLDSVIRCHLMRVLETTRWRIAGPGGAAEILGLKRTTLQSLMGRLRVQRPTR